MQGSILTLKDHVEQLVASLGHAEHIYVRYKNEATGMYESVPLASLPTNDALGYIRKWLEGYLNRNE